MKKFVFTLPVLFLTFAGCDNPTKNDGHAPVITDVLFADTATALLSGPVKTTFKVSSPFYFGIVAADQDLDIVSYTYTARCGETSLGPNTFPAIGQTTVTAMFRGGPVTSGITTAGIWEMSAFVTDSAGHTSNTITKNITVTN
jgi:hypothetical protein